MKPTNKSLLVLLVGIITLTSASAEIRYQYYRFTPTNLRSSTVNLVQLSEFEFEFAGAPISFDDATVDAVDNPPNEIATNLIDGNVDTKWLFRGRSTPIVFTFPTATSIDGYRLATANDSVDRDPVSWTLEGSADGEAWVVIDRVTDFELPLERNAYYPTLTPAPVLAPEIVTFSATPNIVENGTLVDLVWDTNRADNVSILPVLSTDEGQIGALTVMPPGNADTRITLTATNPGGTTSRQINVRSVERSATTTTYLRFTPLAVRNGSNTIQFSEFNLLDGGIRIPATAVTATGNQSPAAEGPDNTIDGDSGTKYLSTNLAPLIFTYPENTSFDGYQIVTANDFADRDPVRFRIEKSTDLTTWLPVDEVSGFDFSTPIARFTESSEIPVPPAGAIPELTFATTTTHVQPGGSATLSWLASEGSTLTLIADGIESPVALTGSQTVQPENTTTYTLTATGPSGFVTSRTLTTTVAPVSEVTTISYDPDFSSAGSEIVLLNSARLALDSAVTSLDGGHRRIRLTGNVGSQTGSAWFANRVATAEGFDTTFGIHLISLTANSGADGMAFVIHDDPRNTAAIPVDTAPENGLGARSLSIAFDSFLNEGEPSAAALRVFANGGTALATVNLAALEGFTPASAGDLTARSGAVPPYTVRVRYFEGKLDVYIDDVLAVDKLAVDLAGIGAADAEGNSFVGFTARTGGVFEAHDVTSWTFGPATDEPVEPDSGFAITHSSFDRAENTATLTWVSEPGNAYRITRSTDLQDWSEVLQTGIVAEAGDTSTATVAIPSGDKAFLRVELDDSFGTP